MTIISQENGQYLIGREQNIGEDNGRISEQGGWRNKGRRMADIGLADGRILKWRMG
jgi:hypothetical protein